MTKLDSKQDETDLAPSSTNPAVRMLYSVLVFLAMLLAVVFGAGVISGFADAGGEDHLAVLLAIVAIWIAVVAGLTWFAARLWPKQAKEPLSPSTKRARNILYFAVAMGVLTGLAIGASSAGDMDFISNGPLPIYPAIIGIVIWTAAMPIMTLSWWRSTDEHDRASYTDGANVAGHAYLFIAPSWWVATRAGLLPAQDPMVVLSIVAFIWSAVWLYRRYF